MLVHFKLKVDFLFSLEYDYWTEEYILSLTLTSQLLWCVILVL